MSGVSRRELLWRASMVGAASVLAQLPGALGPKGLIATAQALDLDVVHDTVNGLLAFVLPGDDEYSRAQGVTFDGAGGVATGAATILIESLDHAAGVSVLGGRPVAVPASAAVAALINSFALEVDPAAAGGVLLSPFARSSFAQKGEVFRRLDADQLVSGLLGEERFISGLLLPGVAFLVFSELGRPVGWEIAGYHGPADGHRDFVGYYQGRRVASPGSTGRHPGRRSHGA